MKKIVTLGEVMLRLSTPDHERFMHASSFEIEFGGSEANVGATLASLGNHVIFLSSFPNHEIGEACVSKLRKNGLDTSFIQYFTGRIGTYFIEHGAMQRSSKIIYDRSDSVFARNACKNVDWDKVFHGVEWFHWSGITPALSQEAADFTLKALSECKEREIKVSADPSYRSNLWAYGKSPQEIMPELLSYSDLIIGGSRDFETCLGLETGVGFPEVFEKLPKLQWIAATSRQSLNASENEYSASFFSREKSFHSRKYHLNHIVDRVGTGDAFAGGLIHGLLNESEEKALALGVAASVMKHSIPGDVLHCSMEELEEIIDQETFGRIKR